MECEYVVCYSSCTRQWLSDARRSLCAGGGTETDYDRDYLLTGLTTVLRIFT